MNHKIIFSLVALLPSLVSSQEIDPVNCDALYAEHLATDLSLDYQAFDQTQGQGFRVLASAGCHGEAADLIEAYIEATGAKQTSLGWHIAQMRATEGDVESAISYAYNSLNEGEVLAPDTLRWNDYVLATIAFLEKDLDALIQHRNRVAEAAEGHFGNALNLKLLDALIRHFDRTYAYATSRIE